MTNAEAIEILRANYTDACHEQLREAVEAAVEALKAQDAAGDTISRQEAVDAVNEWLRLYAINRTMSNVTSIQDILRQLPSAQPEQRWIPCGERLPRDSSEKIVTFTSGYVSTASFVLREKIYCDRMLVSTRENFWQVLEEDEEEGEVVAWMPLPEPYQSEAERKADG